MSKLLSRSRVISIIVWAGIGLVLLVGSFSLAVIALQSYFAQNSHPKSAQDAVASTKVPAKKVTQPAIGQPMRISVSGIGVDTSIVPVGIASDGTMEIDKDIIRTAWYKLGQKPGEIGSAVIAGHYGWVQGQPSVFNKLHTLQTNDTVQVYDALNNLATFKVTQVRSYDPAADATEVFRSTDGKAHLNLITCEGSYNETLKTYSQRLVVFTDLVSVTKI